MNGNRPGEERRRLLESLGPFFAVRGHVLGDAPARDWRPLSDICDDPDALQRRVDAVRAFLAAGAERPVEDIEVRVAASVVQLGLTARLVSPLLALAALGATDQVPALSDVHWQDTLGGAFPLSLPSSLLHQSPRHESDSAADPARWASLLVAGPLDTISRAAAALVPSGSVRVGNMASAVNGALTILTAAGPARVPAEAAERARGLARLLLDEPALRGAATGDAGTPTFRRRSCCLIYRAAATAASAQHVCGDCVLADGPGEPRRRPPRA